MKKNKFIIIVPILLFALVFNTCKKYPEGGLVYSRIKHLFGKDADQSKKSWKLKLYEVNGIDSTNLFKGNNLSIDDNGSFVSFLISQSKNRNYFATTFVYIYYVTIDKSEKLFSISSDLSPDNNDTSQCFLKNNILTCQRNVFNPEKNKFTEWEIRKLTETEFIITKQLNNSYKIILTQ